MRNIGRYIGMAGILSTYFAMYMEPNMFSWWILPTILLALSTVLITVATRPH